MKAYELLYINRNTLRIMSEMSLDASDIKYLEMYKVEFRSDDDVIVRVQFIDLFNVKNSITKIIQQFEVITV